MSTLLPGLFLLVLAGAAGATDRFVAPPGTDTGDCSTSSSPCETLGYAVAQATSGDTVKMAGGQYQGNVLIDTSTTLAISGGWSADFATQDPQMNPTRVVGVAGMAPDPALNYSDVLTVHASSGDVIAISIDGLTLRRGSRGIVAMADDDGVLTLDVSNSIVFGNHLRGIEITADGTASVSASISATLVTRNVNRVFGGGQGLRVFSASTSPVALALVDSRIERNRATSGAGMLAHAFVSGPLVIDIERAVFARNRGQFNGAGLQVVNTQPVSQIDLTIRDSVFSRNRARDAGGGAMYVESADLDFSNVIVTQNRDALGAASGTIHLKDPSGSIVNTTVSRNRGSAGVFAQGSGSVTLRNSILWGHRPASQIDLSLFHVVTIDADHNDIGAIASEGGTFNDLGGNIDADPLLVDGADAHLRAGSPCIDTGTCTGAPPADFEGDPRPSGAGCDMGADEFVP